MGIKNKWGIQLRSRYDGETITLGSQYNKYEEAQAHNNIKICNECNDINIISIPLNAIWINKQIGFVSKEYFKKMMEEKQNGRN